jgi:hypothetical protein
VVDNEESAACGCKDSWVTLGFGGCELLATEFFEGSISFLRFSLAQAFLYVKLAGVKHPRRRNNLHVCLSHMELQQLKGCALATLYLHCFACVVWKGFEPSQ